MASSADKIRFQNQNQNGLLVKCQTDNTTPGGWGLTGGDKSQALTREVNFNLDTLLRNLYSKILETGTIFHFMFDFNLSRFIFITIFQNLNEIFNFLHYIIIFIVYIFFSQS